MRRGVLSGIQDILDIGKNLREIEQGIENYNHLVERVVGATELAQTQAQGFVEQGNKMLSKELNRH